MNISIRETRVIPTLMHWRKEVIEQVFGTMPSKSLMALNRQYYMKHMADGSHIAIIATVDGEDAGCGAICITEELPSPDNCSGRCAYLMNIYVREKFREHGVGHAIVRWLITKAKDLDCDKIFLETTDAAKSLYKNIGFKDLPGIMKYADIQNR